MRKMQEIQPEAKAIQERYAKLKTTDPGQQKMNQELMALYREQRRQPRKRLHPDAAHASGVPRVLRAADDGHRAARRAVRRVDSRSLAAGSLLRAAGPGRRVADPDAVDDAAGGRRSDAAADDDDHAGRPDFRVRIDAGRRADLLAGRQRLAHRPDAADELLHRSAESSRRSGPRPSAA